MIKTYLDGVRLPVNPLDDITLKYQANARRHEIVALGDITTLGNRKLISLEIKSLFTDHGYPWSGSSRGADYYEDMITRMIDNQKNPRLIVTGDGIDINLLCTLESFSPSRRAGEEDECYYTLSLTEYREFAARRLFVVKEKLASSALKTPSKRAGTKEKPDGYTVKPGDCLWNIAKQTYGSGADYKKIYEANRDKISNPNLIYPGQQLTLP